MDFEIRDASISDLEAIVRIYNSTIPSRMVTADTEAVSVESREKWFFDHSATFRPIWVIHQNQETVAWLSFQSFYGRPAYNTTAEISIYVDSKSRKLGLGRTLLERAIKISPELGIKTLLGFIFRHNDPSIGLFKSFGFVEWANLPGIAELDGIERDLVIMGLKTV